MNTLDIIKERDYYSIIFLLTIVLLLLSLKNVIAQGSGKCTYYDGSNDYIEVPALSTNIGNSDFSVECFAWYDVGGLSSTGGLLSTFSTTTGGWMFANTTSGKLAFYYGKSASSGDFDAIYTSSSVSEKSWYFLSAVKSGTTLYFYVNGELQGSVTTSFTVPYNKLHIGKRYINNSSYVHYGAIDEARIWDKALTQSEIRTWMGKKINSGHPEYSYLVAYYNFNTGTGSTLYDQTSNNNDGTLNNGCSWLNSGLRLGDQSTYALTVASGSSDLVLTHPDGDKVTITFTSGSASSFYLMYIDEEPNVTTPPSGTDQLSQMHYFELVCYGGSSLEITVEYDYDGHDGINNESNLRLCSRGHNGITSWTLKSASLNTSDNTLTLTGETPAPGKQYILASTSDNPLPICLKSFTADVNEQNQVLLDWITASEINNDYFSVEQSVDGINWQTIGKLKGKGTSNIPTSYSLIDTDPAYGKNYYRIKQTDFDGNYSYSTVEIANVNQANFGMSVFPNPTINQITIQANEEELKFISIYNSNGQDVTAQTKQKSISKNQVIIDLSSLVTGLYMVNTKYSNKMVFKR